MTNPTAEPACIICKKPLESTLDDEERGYCFIHKDMNVAEMLYIQVTPNGIDIFLPPLGENADKIQIAAYNELKDTLPVRLHGAFHLTESDGFDVGEPDGYTFGT